MKQLFAIIMAAFLVLLAGLNFVFFIAAAFMWGFIKAMIVFIVINLILASLFSCIEGWL